MNSVKDNFGLCCPKCGYDNHLTIGFTGTCELTPDGSVDCGDHEWGDESSCSCSCGQDGIVSDFRVEESDTDEDPVLDLVAALNHALAYLGDASTDDSAEAVETRRVITSALSKVEG